MAKIRQLDDHLINKIAAGEVVERPANVIKELVENAIDAHASRIEIEIIEGGFQSMKVTDNGDGMESVDARLCFMRHATSKIKDDNDLFNIMTLGFRGEAIPSIASVSHFNLQTSIGNKAIQIDYEFGKFIDEKTSDYPKGTTITVTKLFQNVPARLKYLKSVNSEFSQIQRVIERIALAYPDIAFRLYHNERQIFQTNGQDNLLEVIASMYGIATAKNMLPVHIENDEFIIDGYISKIDTNRATKANIITLVNHRYVKNYMSIDAINSAYRAYLADNRYPIAIVNIQVDPYLVDVNVHPSKLEVRFSKEYELKTLIEQGIADALKQVNLTYQQKNKETEKEKTKAEQLSFVLEETQPLEIIQPQPTQHIIKEETKPYSETISIEKIDTYQSEKQVETLKPIKEKIYAKAQIHGTYMIGENEKGMYLCDQHAAQERINYEYYKEKYSHLDLTMQPLIVPLKLEYPLSDFMLIEERKDLLEQVGIHLEVFGEHGYIVRSLPLWMKNIDENIFVDEMIQEVLHKNSLDVVAMQEYAIATLSCKASVKGNTYLTMNDMQTIFDNLMRCDNPYVCPHGRPTLIFYSDYELEKLFKRVI